MSAFRIEGGQQLSGEVVPQGAKNEALQILCSVLLTDEAVEISNLPDIRDVNKLIELLSDMGVETTRLGLGWFRFKASNINLDYLETDEFSAQARALRGSVMIIGPMLARFGMGRTPTPGGDKIGRRRLDTHFIGLQKLGADFTYDQEGGFYRIEGKKLNGTYIHLDEASVTGTANIVMAASLTPGKTTIYNAACEPYLQQLCTLINSMGGNISGIASNMLHIEGVEKLGGAKHRILPDMIEIGSFIGLAATTQADIRIKDAGIKHLGIIPETFRRMGIEIKEEGDDLYIPAQESYVIRNFIDGSILNIADAPWPGFSPDLLSIMLVTATQARGTVLIHQKMFESRLFFVDKLIDMGAQIILCDPHRATVIGTDRKVPLRGIRMTSPDIRAGVSLLIAALAAKGTSVIENVEQIDRGYQNIDTRLKKLGARIERI